MFNIDDELKNLPEQSGVYIMHNSDDEIIYVGKAKILKNRVRQYFQSNSNHTPKVRAMVKNIAYFEYIVTDSELEALVLECNLIKKYSPKYNILLKDDKQYPYIKVTINEDWPKIFMTRTLKKDGAKYFGPYMGTSTVKNTIEIIQKIFNPPTCNRVFPRDINKGRPCLNYHIKNCFAPCMGIVSQEEYKKMFYDICGFLEGDHSKLIKDLENQMIKHSKNLEFEKAASIRDKIKAIKAVDEKQKIINSDRQTDIDVIAIAREGEKAFVEIFFIRAGKMCGRENFKIDYTEFLSEGEIISAFIKQFYESSSSIIPKEILIQYETDEKDILEELLSSMRGDRVKINTPKRGEKVRLIEMTYKNAEIALTNYKIYKQRTEERKMAAFNANEILGIDKKVRYIECYDISNISGSDNVASMVVFENGQPKKSRYRKFKIKSFNGADDYRAMQEVLYRRLNEAREEQEKIDNGEMTVKEAKFLPLPDVIFADGGKGHIEALKRVLEMTDTEIPVFGMVKDDKHRTRALLSDKGEIGLNPASAFFKMVTRMQDEVHRTAISYHRKLHEKIRSELDNIEGVGAVRRTELLAHFKSVENIKNATVEELMRVKGMNEKAAKKVKEYFND